MSPNGRIDVTDDALYAVLQHLTSQDMFKKEGFAGYEYPNKNDKNKFVTLMVYDENHVVVSKKLIEELQEYKKIYEGLCK